MKKEYPDDDGRTIANMDHLPDTSYLGAWITRRASENLHSRERKTKNARVPRLDRDEKRSLLTGALGASLLVAFIFLAAFAAVIVLMLWIFGVL